MLSLQEWLGVEDENDVFWEGCQELVIVPAPLVYLGGRGGIQVMEMGRQSSS